MTKPKVDKSNYDPRKCQATSKRTGLQCGQWKMNGTQVCKMHGANLPAAKAKHKRQQEEEKLRKAARRLGTPVEGQDPSQVLLDQIAHKAAEVEWLRRMVDTIQTDEEMFWADSKEVVRDTPTGTLTETVKDAGQHAIYAVLHKAQDQLVKYAEATLRAGVEERQVQAAERTGQQFEQVLMAVLAAVDATPAQLKLASVEVPRILKSMASK